MPRRPLKGQHRPSLPPPTLFPTVPSLGISTLGSASPGTLTLRRFCGDLMLSADESLPVLKRTHPEGLGRAGRTAEASGPAQVPPPAAATCSLPLSLHPPGGPSGDAGALGSAPHPRGAAPRRWDSATAVVPSSRTTNGIVTTQVKGVITTRQPFYSTVCGPCGCGLEVVATRAQRSAVWRRGPQAARPQRRVGLHQPELRVRPGATWRRGHRRAKVRSRGRRTLGPARREAANPTARRWSQREQGSTWRHTRGGFGEKGCVLR